MKIAEKVPNLTGNNFINQNDMGQIISRRSGKLWDERHFFNCFDIDERYEDLFDLESMPRMIDVAGLCICFEGTAEIIVNAQRYCLQKGDMCVILPKSILKLAGKSDDFRGYTIAVTQKFFNQINIPSSTSIYLYVKENPCISLNQEQQARLLKFCNDLEAHDTLENHLFRQEISALQAMVVVYEIIAIYKSKQPLMHQPYTRKNKLFLEFQQLITTHYSKHKTIDFYADKLCVSTRYLSSVAKEISGLTASDCITRVVLLNAKILLSDTEKTIQQISDSLNFPNPSFFSKYFKRNTGKTPREYRAKG